MFITDAASLIKRKCVIRVYAHKANLLQKFLQLKISSIHFNGFILVVRAPTFKTPADFKNEEAGASLAVFLHGGYGRSIANNQEVMVYSRNMPFCLMEIHLEKIKCINLRSSSS